MEVSKRQMICRLPIIRTAQMTARYKRTVRMNVTDIKIPPQKIVFIVTFPFSVMHGCLHERNGFGQQSLGKKG